MHVGVYKKTHRHGPVTHVMSANGVGFSFLWYDFRRLDWKHGISSG